LNTALKPKRQGKYARRLEIFFDFYKKDGKAIKEKSENFLEIT
jgi:hypothetical protein